MITKEITICKKQVTVAYCFATEIGFMTFTGQPIDTMETTNPEHIIYLILAALHAYYQKDSKDSPVKDEDLMYDATPEELYDAIKEIMNLRGEWYKTLLGDKQEKPAETEKNA